MNIDELFEATVVWTNKPELVPETRLAIQRATNMAHLIESWKLDFHEKLVTLDAANYVFQIPTEDNFPRLKNVEYFRKWDPSALNVQTSLLSGAAGVAFDEIDAKDVFDTYQMQKSDVYYQSGSGFNFRSSDAIQYVLAGWYQLPIVSPIAQFSSWIAEKCPQVIYDQAAAMILAITGNPDAAKVLNAMVQEDVATMRSAFLYSQAR